MGSEKVIIKSHIEDLPGKTNMRTARTGEVMFLMGKSDAAMLLVEQVVPYDYCPGSPSSAGSDTLN